MSQRIRSNYWKCVHAGSSLSFMPEYKTKEAGRILMIFKDGRYESARIMKDLYLPVKTGRINNPGFELVEFEDGSEEMILFNRDFREGDRIKKEYLQELISD